MNQGGDGIEIIIPGKKKSRKNLTPEERNEQDKNKFLLDYFVLADIEDDDLCLAEIAVDSKLRGQGIGKKVVCDVIDYARRKGYKRVTLDADFRNKGAKRLYEKIGFKEFNKKRVKIGKFERGMYNMELVL